MCLHPSPPPFWLLTCWALALPQYLLDQAASASHNRMDMLACCVMRFSTLLCCWCSHVHAAAGTRISDVSYTALFYALTIDDILALIGLTLCEEFVRVPAPADVSQHCVQH